MREDEDLLGKILVSDAVYYGAQTQRALHLCNPSKEKFHCYPELIASITAIKKACALVHQNIGVLPKEIARGIIAACDEILAGKFQDQFPVDLINGGGCVSIHMNVNEVIASRANELLCGKKEGGLVHGNTHVNMGQSTNDVIPAALKLALYKDLGEVISAVNILAAEFSAKSALYKDCVKVSRTCFQEAVPMTLGQYYGACSSFLQRQLKDLAQIKEECLFIPLGATAIGTGLGTFKGFQEEIMPELSAIFGAEVRQEADLFDGLQYGDIYIKASACLKSIAAGISKMARDIRIMSSGPRSGLGEIKIAPVQNGSSIMPGKVNPALPELMNIVCYQICGNDVSTTMAVEGGELELNVWEAVVIVNLLQSCQLLSETIPVFAKACVATITADKERCLRGAELSLAQAVVVSALLGYKTGAKVAQYAADHQLSIKETVIQMGLMEKGKAEELLNPLMLTDVKKSGQVLLDIALAKQKTPIQY